MNRNVTAAMGCGAIILLSALTGCGGSPDICDASGVLTYQGTPLPNVEILFSPVDGRRGSAAMTGENGEFTMRYTGSQDGVVPGEHIVFVRYIPPNPEEGMAVLEGRAKVKGKMGEVLKKYGKMESSTYRVTVENDVNDLKIDLQ